MPVAQIVAHGIDIVLGEDTRYDVAGFSFGGTMATCVGAIHGARVRSVTIIGSSGVGPSGSAVELMKVRHLSGEERVATHRINLNRLMIADPTKIDDLALAIQEWNTRHSRLKTPMLSRSGALPRALTQVRRAGERHLGRARRAGQSAGAAACRGVARAATGCRCADDSPVPAIGWRTRRREQFNAMLLEMLAHAA